MKQTAIEWLENEFQEMCKDFGGIHSEFIVKFEQAKAMEKEQIMDAFREGGVKYSAGVYPEQYYKETYLQSHTPKHYRVWFEDTMEEDGGYWWNAVTDPCGRLYDPKHPNEERDTVQWYIDNGYKVEEVTNG